MTDYTHIEEQIERLCDPDVILWMDDHKEIAETMTDMLAIVRAAKAFAMNTQPEDWRRMCEGIAELENPDD